MKLFQYKTASGTYGIMELMV